jgi:hypothetical protein
MGKPWETHGKPMGKPWENHGKIMGKSWIHDSADLVYFYNDLDYVKLEKNEDGTIKNIIMKNNIPKFKDFNKIIIKYFENDYRLLNLKFKNNK